MTPRWVYTNGRYSRYDEAAVHVEDRGFQFADSVYEVIPVRNGALVNLAPHFARLGRSLDALRIAMPMRTEPLTVILQEVVRRNLVRHGLAYIQITRGRAERDHAFPGPDIKPSLIVLARSVMPAQIEARAQKGVRVRSMKDLRWGRRDIKSTGLLANVLAKQEAREAGAFEAWLTDNDGLVTEGASTNAWIVDREGRLRTRALSTDILPGVTRQELMVLCETMQIAVSTAPFTIAEAQTAREAFITAATIGVMPVVEIDGAKIGSGEPGPVALRLRQSYWARAPIVD